MALGISVRQAKPVAEEAALLCNGLYCVCSGETQVAQRVLSNDAGHASIKDVSTSDELRCCTGLDNACAGESRWRRVSLTCRWLSARPAEALLSTGHACPEPISSPGWHVELLSK